MSLQLCLTFNMTCCCHKWLFCGCSSTNLFKYSRVLAGILQCWAHWALSGLSDRLEPTSGLDSAVWYSVVQCCEVLCSVIQCCAVLCSIVHCCALLCSVIQCSAVQCCALLCTVVQCCIVLCSVVLCNTVQCVIVQCNSVHTAHGCVERSQVQYTTVKNLAFPRCPPYLPCKWYLSGNPGYLQ